MAKKKISVRSFEDAVAWLRSHGFDVVDAPATTNRVFIRKYNCSAAIERTSDGRAKLFAYPGYVINSEISKLVDQGYQKVLKTSKAEYPATADHLRALHQFSEELKEAIGATSLYNESMGTVSESYQYDRVKGRDLPAADRPKRPWQKPAPERKQA